MENTEVGLKLETSVRSPPEVNALFLPGEVGAILDSED